MGSTGLRQRSHAGPKQGEASNSLRHAVSFHRQGEIRDRACENQNLPRSCLGQVWRTVFHKSCGDAYYAASRMNTYARTMIDAAFAAYQAGQHAQAAMALRFVVGTGADAFVAWFIGHLELRRGDAAAALPWLTSALAFDPAHAKARSNLGDAFRMLGQVEEAAAAYRQAIASDPKPIEPYSGLTVMLHLLNRDTEALGWAERAVRDAGDTAAAHRTTGNVLTRHNRHRDAISHYQAAQALCPDDPVARYHEGLAWLALGEYRDGWRLHDARRQITREESGRRDIALPLWRGDSDIAGQNILLHSEQGLGDAIEFVRYAGVVAARGALVWLEADPALCALFASIPGLAGVVAPGDARPECTVHCPLMSLPLAFGTELGSIPSRVPYLHANARRVAAWRAVLGGDARPRVGLAWSGNPQHPYDRLRSIGLDRLEPLLARRDCVFHVVQPGVSEADRSRLSALNVRDHSVALTDFAETAALMDCLDLVITVDSAQAHLAGALGRPTWLLLAWHADWRWMCDRQDSPWYPTMRLFRQPAAGDWESVMAAVGTALDIWLQTP
jgi:tetratricopeptide (TPR) repeat protein